MTTQKKFSYPIGTLVLDEWYGLGIIVEIDGDGNTSGYKNKVKFFYGKQRKQNVYNDREINDLHHNYLLASEKGKKYLVDNIQGRFNNGRHS